MASSISLLLLFSAILPISFAIKCLVQPDFEEFKKFLVKEAEESRFSGRPINPKNIKEGFLKLLKTPTNVDCAVLARQYDFPEATHCFSFAMKNCPVIEKDFPKEFGSLEGILGRGCVSDELIREYAKQGQGRGSSPSIANAKEKITPENYCRIYKEMFGCTRCSVCSDRDFCNEGIDIPSGEKNVPSSACAGQLHCLFLLLLAIVSGAWAVFR